MKVFIYTLSDNKGNIRYIGKTKDIHDRKRRHISSYYLKENTHKNNWIKSIINKKEDIIIEVLDVVDNSNWEFWEKYWISQFKQWGFNLVNGTNGGDGFDITVDVIKKRNATNVHINNKKNKEIIENHNIHYIDGIWKAERKCGKCGNLINYKSKCKGTILNMIRRSNKENRLCNSCKVSGENNYFYGKNLNDGDIKRKKYGKALIQYDKNGIFVCEYESIRVASEITGIDRKSISYCAMGKKYYNTAGGYIFKYKNK